MSLSRTVKKIKRMSCAEIAWRVSERIRMERLRLETTFPSCFKVRHSASWDSIVARCRELIPGSKPSELAKSRLQFPDIFAQWSSESADTSAAIVSGRFQILGRPITKVEDIDWHRDPVSGHAWSNLFFSRVSYHKIPSHVDFKHIWELGRLQFAVELARSCQLSGNASHGCLSRHVLLDWLRDNSFCRGIHWTSGLEVAVRAISIIWILAHLNDFDGWESEEKIRIVESLALHAHYLANHLSVFSSPYNHLIGEGTGLYLLGILFENEEIGARWKLLGRRVLNQHAPKQFYQDGFCVEQAVGYHYFTLSFLLLAQAGSAFSNDRDLNLTSVLTKGFECGKLFQQLDGQWPPIGDVDSALGIPVVRERYWDFSPLHQVACHLLKNSSISSKSDKIGQEVYWLIGYEGLQGVKCIPNEEPIKVEALPDSGYFIFKNRSQWLLLDSGNVAGGVHRDSTPSAAHGHDDCLQVLLQMEEGFCLLSDGGMPNYAGDRSRAAHFRSPAAHNCLRVRGLPFVKPAGGLSWSNEVGQPRLVWQQSQEHVMALGQVELADCTIRRHLLVLPEWGIGIADVVHSPTARGVDWYWQLPERSEMERSAQSITVRMGSYILHTYCQDPFDEVVGAEAMDGSYSGWKSPGYGQLSPVFSLSCSQRISNGRPVLTYIGKPGVQFGFETGSSSALVYSGQSPTVDGIAVDRAKWLRLDSFGFGHWTIGSHSIRG